MTYEFVSDTHAKLIDADKEERDRRIDFEIILWQTNDVRTYMDTTVSMMKLDLCNQRVKLPIVHVAVNPDRYFDNNVVEQHLNVIYEKVDVCISKIPGGHAPTVVATAKEAEHFLPSKIKRLLSKAP